MKKTLLFIILSFFVLQNQVFATVQKVPEKGTISQKAKPSLSFKQKVFTYLLQRKMRRLNAKQPNFFVQKDSIERECVTIQLKNGRSIAATITSMDDQKITYKLCNHQNRAEGIVRMEQVTSIKNANNQLIFDNNAKKEEKIDKVGITTGAISFGAGLITLFLFVISLDSESGDFIITLLLGLGITVVTGIISLISRASKRKKYPLVLAILVSIPLILCLLFLFLFLINRN